MSKFKLAFGIHNHQPVGNFEAVFEEAHRHAYLPFLQLVSKQSNFRMSLHQSGILWEWQKKNHPDYFKLVKSMIKKGQLEIMTGGFYEPILTAIPSRDVKGQIELLSQYIKENFGVNPSGLWLTERVWEPHLPEIIAECNVNFVSVDDAHFTYAGFEDSDLREPFVTESNGLSLTLLPIQKRLRYLIPFGSVDEVIAELKQQAENNADGLAVYADDGEKFGVWPGTFNHCYEKGWLESFFEAIENNSDWLEVIPLSEASMRKPIGRAYLPSASYSEMLHWSLPSQAYVEYEEFEKWLKESGQFDRYGRFVRGGHWRNFLSKYDESNLMHKKMLYVSNRLNAAKKSDLTEDGKLESIKRHLYAGQCNCPYWHGVFGGLYLPHIRQAIYSELLKAEDELNNSKNFTIQMFDYDSDSQDEIVASNGHFSAVFKPSNGGTLTELSLLKEHFNLTDTLSRRHEGYHLKLRHASQKHYMHKTASIHDTVKAKEDNLDSLLINDWYLKRCFMDHCFAEGTSIETFEKNKYSEEGDFILEPFESTINAESNRIKFVRNGHVRRIDRTYNLEVRKTFTFKENLIEVAYQLNSDSKEGVHLQFGIENNFNFQAGHAEDRYVLVDGVRPDSSFLDSVDESEESKFFTMIDEYRGLAVAVDSERTSKLWRMPIFTVSMSEGGFEKVYQGTTFVNVFQLILSKSPVVINLTLFAGSLSELPARYRAKSEISASS